MSERGIDISREFAKPWTDEIVRAADVVVSLLREPEQHVVEAQVEMFRESDGFDEGPHDEDVL
jgi:protein-tyrosine-phosphatase